MHPHCDITDIYGTHTHLMTAESPFLLLVDGIFIKIAYSGTWSKSQKWKEMKSWGRCSLKIMGLNYESLTASPGGWASAPERCGARLKLWGILVWRLQESSQGRSQRKDQRWGMTSGKEGPWRPEGGDSPGAAVLATEMAIYMRTEANPLGLETLEIISDLRKRRWWEMRK